MDTYSVLRQLADSWVLLLMFAFFVAVILWAFRPGSTKIYKDVANIPLADDTPPEHRPSTDRKSEKGADDV